MENNRYLNAALDIMSVIGDIYFVGGCVRDYVIYGSLSNDIDLVTRKPLNDCLDLLVSSNLDIKVGMFGLSFEVLKVSYFKDGECFDFDIAKTRVDVGVLDGRHPNKVITEGVDYLEDLQRRDFTCNTLLMDRNFKVYDLLGTSLPDIENKLLRVVGGADRFKEDYLRIYRAMRFSSTLGFALTEDTFTSMHMLADASVGKIASERIRVELEKMFAGDYLLEALAGLKYNKALNLIGDGLYRTCGYDQKSKYHHLDLFDHSLETLSRLYTYRPDSFLLKYAALMHDIGKLDCQEFDEDGDAHYYLHAVKGVDVVEPFIKSLNYSSNDVKYISNLIKHHDFYLSISSLSNKSRDVVTRIVRNKVVRDGFDLWDGLIPLMLSDAEAHIREEGDDTVEVAHMIANVYYDYRLVTKSVLEALQISGKDFLDVGFKGAELGREMAKLYTCLYKGVVFKDRVSILNYISQRYIDVQYYRSLAK